MEQVPTGIPDKVREYIFRQLARIEQLAQTAKPQVLTSLPAKPRVSQLYYFSNTILPDITSEGMWVYKSTGWSYLGDLGGGGGGVSDGDKGDVVVTGSGTVWTVDTGVIGTTKLGVDITSAGKALLDDANAAAQRTTLGLGNVDDTSDLSKPISTATATALSGKASTVHSHVAADVTDFSEAVDNRVAALLVAGSNVTLTYNDIANTLTVAASGGSGGAASFITVEKDLGSSPRTAGSFSITGLSGLTIGKPVLITQAVGPYTGKGTLADEAEMDQVSVSASVTAANTITAYWTAMNNVMGNFKFDYLVGA